MNMGMEQASALRSSCVAVAAEMNAPVDPVEMALASALAAAIVWHQCDGRGIRPLADWGDHDVTSDSAVAWAMDRFGLHALPREVSKLEGLVSAVVFGAFHQGYREVRFDLAVNLLEAAGCKVAEVRWVPDGACEATRCPLSGESVLRPAGYWPFVDDEPVSLSVFAEEIREVVKEVVGRAGGEAQLIGGYFIAGTLPQLAVTPSWVTLHVHARSVVGNNFSRQEDVEVPGMYAIQVPPGIPSEEQASIALDVFHGHVAVGCLDDFEFEVVDPATNAVLEEDGKHEAYSGESLGYCSGRVGAGVPGVFVVRVEFVGPDGKVLPLGAARVIAGGDEEANSRALIVILAQLAKGPDAALWLERAQCDTKSFRFIAERK